jgi:hypothetical protein
MSYYLHGDKVNGKEICLTYNGACLYWYMEIGQLDLTLSVWHTYEHTDMSLTLRLNGEEEKNHFCELNFQLIFVWVAILFQRTEYGINTLWNT